MRVPHVENGVDVVEAPIVVLRADTVLLNGVAGGSVGEIVRTGDVRELPELHAKLAERRRLFALNDPGKEFPGELLLTMPVETPAVVLKSIVRTAAHAGYTHIGMLVSNDRPSMDEPWNLP